MASESRKELEEHVRNMTWEIAYLIEGAEKHHAKIKANSYKSQREQLRSVFRMQLHLASLRNRWAVMKDLLEKGTTLRSARRT